MLADMVLSVLPRLNAKGTTSARWWMVCVVLVEGLAPVLALPVRMAMVFGFAMITALPFSLDAATWLTISTTSFGNAQRESTHRLVMWGLALLLSPGTWSVVSSSILIITMSWLVGLIANLLIGYNLFTSSWMRNFKVARGSKNYNCPYFHHIYEI